jgi:hypothetical protein
MTLKDIGFSATRNSVAHTSLPCDMYSWCRCDGKNHKRPFLTTVGDGYIILA